MTRSLKLHSLLDILCISSVRKFCYNCSHNLTYTAYCVTHERTLNEALIMKSWEEFEWRKETHEKKSTTSVESAPAKEKTFNVVNAPRILNLWMTICATYMICLYSRYLAAQLSRHQEVKIVSFLVCLSLLSCVAGCGQVKNDLFLILGKV